MRHEFLSDFIFAAKKLKWTLRLPSLKNVDKKNTYIQITKHTKKLHTTKHKNAIYKKREHKNIYCIHKYILDIEYIYINTYCKILKYIYNKTQKRQKYKINSTLPSLPSLHFPECRITLSRGSLSLSDEYQYIARIVV